MQYNTTLWNYYKYHIQYYTHHVWSSALQCIFSSVSWNAIVYIRQHYLTIPVITSRTHKHNARLTAFVQDYPGEPVPER